MQHPSRGNAPSQASGYYIGLMSGTSTDGVDAVLADLEDPSRPNIISSVSLPMPAPLRAEFLALNEAGSNELERAALAGNDLARLYAAAVNQVLNQSGFRAEQVNAIGAHGQTVRHDPAAGYTIQINAPALLAELTGIAVISDFRSRDIAAGGQGAPLVPAFHHALFANTDACRAILNLGGIANVTLLDPRRATYGFDTGPANVLLDTWIQDKRNEAYDNGGSWAASGHVNTGLLDFLLASEPWLEAEPPKSTGRHLFNRTWLSQRLTQYESITTASCPDADVQATLQAFTARSIATAIKHHAPDTLEVIVCGGGALNTGLMAMLAKELPACTLTTTAEYGVPVQQMEALAFAWLAQAHEHGTAGSLPEVTGATARRVLGCRYPA